MRDEQMMDAPAIKGTDIFDTTMTESNVRGVPALIVQLYQTVRALNKLFPDRPFTPDGHLVGSIGEVIAADTYDLTLEKCSNAGFDAKTQTLRTVEIKLTGGDSVSVSSDCNPPEFLIVLKLNAKTDSPRFTTANFQSSCGSERAPVSGKW